MHGRVLGGGVILVGLVLGCESYPSVSVDRGVEYHGHAGAAASSSSSGGTDVQLRSEAGATSSGGAPSHEAVCGDGELDATELCDDGNEEDDDGCSADCSERDPNYQCPVPGEDCELVVVCGSGVLEGDEVCDDGNEEDGDGCSADCSEVEDGWTCPRPGRPCVELPVCGNGTLERGEECDDGNEESDDGCSGTEESDSPSCQVEDGFWCPAAGEDCVALVCGDGTRTPDEACDDGNDDEDDGCSPVCEVEPGWRCSQSGCRPLCGDELIVSNEECDDGDRESGDGCSAACRTEPFWDCTGEPSECESTIECGNETVEPGEICDPPGENGCNSGCASFAPDEGDPPVCGNDRIEAGETCDPPDVGHGCGELCQAEPGYVCPRPGTCYQIPDCGDGRLQLGEECDVGSVSSSGCVDCQIETGWFCYGSEPSVCEYPECGDGIRSPNEECDDENLDDSDGCTGECEVEGGWVCPDPGEPCLPVCGDDVVLGHETCDDGNRDNGDGCNAACHMEPGYVCTIPGSPCEPTVCGNDEEEPGEGCDDGNLIAGDGCGPTCQDEPSVTVGPEPVVNVFCGDGLVTGSEECDDGNDESGDGCSDGCEVEEGYACEDRVTYPPFVEFAVTYRDFKADLEDGGHPDFEWEPYPFRRDMPGPVCTTSNDTLCAVAPGVVCPAGTCGALDAEGKPAHHLTGTANARGRVTSADTYALWYRNTNAGHIEGANGEIDMCHVADSLRLDQIGGTDSDVYRFDSTSHFPLGDRCFGTYDTTGSNYHFTTELRYFFQYRGGETLTFRGDDDVWVFMNGRHAVDIGGVHTPLWGRVILGDDGDGAADDSDCSAHGTSGEPADCSLEPEETASTDDQRFALYAGGVYEIVLFHAERHTVQSNFRLTLAGFLAPRSYCAPICGDGIVVGWEVCDDGEDNSDDEYGQCNTLCTGSTFCGDGVTQGPSDDPSGPEECDNGRNVDVYGSGANGCGPGCLLPGRCGDGVVQFGFEQCDNGAANADDAYGPTACRTDCTLGSYCGDGVVDDPETCDDGPLNGGEYGAGTCGYDCEPGPFCGDGVRNGPEECDGSDNCRPDCTLEPYCGDGLTALSAGEECDYGQFASDAYGSCTDECEWGPHCGDGEVDEEYEECDLGEDRNDGGYDGCTATCNLGPHCGDGVRQASEGEQCDNAFNDDVYAWGDDACGANCTLPPYCGDGTVQSSFELCDDGDDNSDSAYNGCTTDCTWGPYCGDGDINGPETCDDGPDNTLYSADGEGCGPDCEPAPYCGDGIRNGSEQCDDGEEENTGEYGGCNPDCTRAPHCGDYEVQTDEGEECDDGPVGSLDCTPDCRGRGEIH